jgi:hypothetical protein
MVLHEHPRADEIPPCLGGVAGWRDSDIAPWWSIMLAIQAHSNLGWQAMALAQEDIEFIKNNLGAWLAEQSLGKPPVVYEIELRERMVRVEEELKHQRELMRQGFELMEKRFEQVDKRFEQVDKRFEQVDKRFDEMLRRHDRHFLWLVGFIATSAGLVIAASRLL